MITNREHLAGARELAQGLVVNLAERGIVAQSDHTDQHQPLSKKKAASAADAALAF
jgi:hypothetical protein